MITTKKVENYVEMGTFDGINYSIWMESKKIRNFLFPGFYDFPSSLFPDMPRHKKLKYIIKNNNIPIGFIEVTHYWSEYEAEVAYGILKSYRKRGYASIALRQILFKLKSNIKYVYANNINLKNIGSQLLAKSLGFVQCSKSSKSVSFKLDMEKFRNGL